MLHQSSGTRWIFAATGAYLPILTPLRVGPPPKTALEADSHYTPGLGGATAVPGTYLRFVYAVPRTVPVLSKSLEYRVYVNFLWAIHEPDITMDNLNGKLIRLGRHSYYYLDPQN